MPRAELGAPLLGVALALLTACGPSSGPGPAAPTAAAGGPEVAMTDRGAVRGARAGDTLVFKGIPYAAPPVGPLRWRPPQPAARWRGVRDATGYGYVCMQTAASNDPEGTPMGSEDCLTLNVWRPKASRPLPVMVYVHGGYFTWGSSSLRRQGVDLHDGRQLAERAQVVVVTINYRVGALGFLAHRALAAEDERHTTGNYGLLDQVAALEWVQRNAAAFGGEPARVTVFGQSAGAISIAALVASPRARGLFAGAIMHSGGHAAVPLQLAQSGGDVLTRNLGCAGDRDVAACLRARSASAVVSALPESYHGGYHFAPVVDGVVLPARPLELVQRGAHNHVPLMVGTTSREFSTMVHNYLLKPIKSEADYREAVARRFGRNAAAVLAHYPASSYPSPLEAFEALLGDVGFVCQSDALGRAAGAAQRQPVWRFVFAHTYASGSVSRFGAGHGLDLILVNRNFPAAWVQLDPAELALSDTVIGYWSRFARTGDPNGAGAPAWPRYDAAGRRHLVLDVPIREAVDGREAECAFIRGAARDADGAARPSSRPSR
jgi:para-nitrobenzyl esterase